MLPPADWSTEFAVARANKVAATRPGTVARRTRERVDDHLHPHTSVMTFGGVTASWYQPVSGRRMNPAMPLFTAFRLAREQGVAGAGPGVVRVPSWITHELMTVVSDRSGWSSTLPVPTNK
jgi:hypothetical protein